MSTIVNNPTPVQNSGDNGGSGFLIGTIILVIFVGILLYFAIPAIKNMGPVQVNVPTPEITVESPKVTVPAPPTETTPTQ